MGHMGMYPADWNIPSEKEIVRAIYKKEHGKDIGLTDEQMSWVGTPQDVKDAVEAGAHNDFVTDRIYDGSCRMRD